MIVDLSDVVALLASGTYTVTRPAASTITSGRKVAGTPTTFTITASVHPTPGRVLELLPEGFRGRGGVTLYTSTKLKGAAGVNQEPDVVTIDGEAHQVATVEDWSALGNYYRAICVRLPA